RRTVDSAALRTGATALRPPLDGAQPHPPYEAAAWSDDGPVRRKSAPRRRVGCVDASLSEDETCTLACILDAEVHHRLRYARDCEPFELHWRRRSLHAGRGNDDDSDDELAVQVLRQQQESRPCGNLQDRLIPRRIQDAFGTCSPESSDPRQRPKQRNLAGRHFLDGPVDPTPRRADEDPVGLAELVYRSKFF